MTTSTEPDRIDTQKKNPKIETDIYYGIGGCVFKVFYGDKYIISMGKYLKNALDMLNIDISGMKNKRDSLFKKDKGGQFIIFSDYVYNNPDHEFKVDILLRSNNPYRLLKRCQVELDDAIADRDCLNSFFIPFLSRKIQCPIKWWSEREKKKNKPYWINRGHYLNYRKWLYSRNVI
jgi:hypothetical protein